MQAYYPVAIVTLLTGALCFWMAAMVSRAHVKVGILPPQMSGDPFLERTFRAHVNTIEWMPIFLPSLWLFAIYWSPTWAAAFGAIWIVGRVIYFLSYRVAAEKRFVGFGIQALAAFALMLGALGRILYLMATS
jgi:glutathione S-transferase